MILVNVIGHKYNDYFGMMDEELIPYKTDLRLVWLSVSHAEWVHKDCIHPFLRTSKFLGHSTWIKENETK